MSERTLIRRFKEGMGISPIEYVIRRRIRRGAELLREHPASIAETAFAVGFTDSNYFSRQFKRMMGVTPRAFVETTVREWNRNNQEEVSHV